MRQLICDLKANHKVQVLNMLFSKGSKLSLSPWDKIQSQHLFDLVAYMFAILRKQVCP